MIRSAQSRWAGQGVRMSDERLPKKIYGELKHGKRPRGGQSKTVQGLIKNLSKRVLR